MGWRFRIVGLDYFLLHAEGDFFEGEKRIEKVQLDAAQFRVKEAVVLLMKKRNNIVSFLDDVFDLSVEGLPGDKICLLPR